MLESKVYSKMALRTHRYNRSFLISVSVLEQEREGNLNYFKNYYEVNADYCFLITSTV